MSYKIKAKFLYKQKSYNSFNKNYHFLIFNNFKNVSKNYYI